jgi:hypothetical protein
MFDQLSAGILPSLIKGAPSAAPSAAPTTKQNVDPAVHFVYSRVKTSNNSVLGNILRLVSGSLGAHHAERLVNPKVRAQIFGY